MGGIRGVRRIDRRQFLRRTLINGVRLGVAVWLVELTGQGLDLWRQRNTWRDADHPNEQFFARHASDLQRLSLGGSFAPEQWSLDAAGQQEALTALKLAHSELGMRQMRLGLRWKRVHDRSGALSLHAYDAFIDACLDQGADVCLNFGAVKTFRWPEVHVPAHVLAKLDTMPPADSTISAADPLAAQAFAYLDELFPLLRSEYGSDAFAMVQVENEPFYPLGEGHWRMGRDYLEEVSLRAAAAFPRASILLTSAGRLNLDSVRDLFVRLMTRDEHMQGRLVSGFDFHYRTPLRDSYPLVRYLDQVSYARPFAASCEQHIHDARDAGFSIEVTEGQAEPYGYLTQPGNSARDFRYMILRCLDEVLDPLQPALIRVWGVEELAKKMLRGQLTDEHRAIIDLIQTVNFQASERVES